MISHSSYRSQEILIAMVRVHYTSRLAQGSIIQPLNTERGAHQSPDIQPRLSLSLRISSQYRLTSRLIWRSEYFGALNAVEDRVRIRKTTRFR